MNGTFSLLGFDLPMSSHLSTQDGFLSFNLETTEMPFQPPEQLDALNALFPLAELEKPWAQAQNLLRAGRGFALTGLNFTFDVTTATVSSLWLRLRLPGFDIQGPFASRFSAIEISWLVGLTSSAPEVSTSGWVAEVAVAGFEGAKWECYVKPWPELHFSLWTPSDGLSIDSVFAQLSNAGAKITPEQISLASGFFLTRYGNRLEVHIGLPGRNAVRIL